MFDFVLPGMPKKIILDIIKKKPHTGASSAHDKESKKKSPKKARRKFRKICLRLPELEFKPLYLGAGLFALIIIILAGTNLLSSATVEITPKQQAVKIDSKFTAKTSEEKGTALLELMRTEKESAQIIKSSQTKLLNQKASGKIIVYNNYGSNSQPLITNTRFEAPNGNVYRIQKRIVVPGKPGSIEVTVYADEPGEGYNIGLVDFTIPGFKGTVKYEKFYARSKTEMTGGYEGDTAVITRQVIEEENVKANDSLAEGLEGEIRRQKPAGFVLYDEAIVLDFEGNGDAILSDQIGESFELKTKVTATGFLLDEAKLARKLAENYLTETPGADVRISNIDELEFELLSYRDDQITFNIKGDAHFVWNIDTESLANELATLNGKDTVFIFSKYPEIRTARVLFSPPWWRFIPNKSSRIRFAEILNF